MLSLVIQNVNCDKNYFTTKEQAVNWAEGQGFDVSRCDDMGDYYTFLQAARDRFVDESIQPYEMSKGVHVLVGKLKDIPVAQQLDETGTATVPSFDHLADRPQPMLCPPSEMPEPEMEPEIESEPEGFCLGEFELLLKPKWQFSMTDMLICAAMGQFVQKSDDKNMLQKVTESNVTDPEQSKVQIFKADSEKKIVYGVVLEPNSQDAQDDIMEPEEIEDTAHNYMINYQIVGKEHAQKLDARVVESWIVPVDFVWHNQFVKKGSWVLAVKINDDVAWKKIKDREYNSFSVGGLGLRKKK